MLLTMAVDDGGRRWLEMALADDRSRWLVTVGAMVGAEAKFRIGESEDGDSDVVGSDGDGRWCGMG